MNRYIPNDYKCVCTVDGEKVTPLMRCKSDEECIGYCNKLNGVEDDKTKLTDRHSETS